MAEVPERDGPMVDGRYRLTAHVAGGGMGDVWRAVDERLGRDVAVKVLKAHLAADHEFRERFRSEARAAAALNHPSIAAVYDYGEVLGAAGGPQAYLVMEFVEGEPLEQLLVREGRLDPITTLALVAQTAAGLEAAHEAGIVHRDIKPGNLMIRPDGSVKITDFGIARAGDTSALTRTGTMLGTVEYMSPEQLAGRSATGSSDLYALGVVAFRCLAGRTPFNAPESMAVALAHVNEPVPPLPADVPAPVSALVSGLLAKDPADRPPSAGALAGAAADLRDALGTASDGGVAGPPPGAGGATVAVGGPGRAGSDGGVAAARTQVLAAGTAVHPGPPRTVVPGGGGRRLGRRRVQTAALVVAGLVVLAALLALWFAGGPGQVTVPDLRGIPVGLARSRLASDGLKATVRVADLPAPSAGTVVTQRPRAGARVTSGAVVVLDISSGFVDVVPSALVGVGATGAEASLAALGLHATTVSVSSTQAPGTVVTVAPQGRLPTGSTVTLGVAVTPPPTTTTTTTTAPGPVTPIPPGQQGNGPGKGGGNGPAGGP